MHNTIFFEYERQNQGSPITNWRFKTEIRKRQEYKVKKRFFTKDESVKSDSFCQTVKGDAAPEEREIWNQWSEEDSHMTDVQ